MQRNYQHIQVCFYIAECTETIKCFGYLSLLSNRMFTDVIFYVSLKLEMSVLD